VFNEKEWKKEYRQRNKQRISKYQHEWYLRNKEHLKEYRQENRGRETERNRLWRILHRKEFNEWARDYNKKMRIECLIHYGGNPPRCACCNENHIDFLTLDHINGHGRQEIKRFGYRSGSYFYSWLIKNNFPVLLQVMCYNCNCSKKDSEKLFCPVHHPELYIKESD
jgi:hypothetical protein